MRKPNPLDTLFLGFKILTATIGEIGGICLIVNSVIFLGSFIGLWSGITGLIIFYMGRDLTKTIAKEEKESEGGDEGPDLPLRAV